MKMLANTLNGKGVMTLDDGAYDGEFKNGKREGRGIYTWDNGDKYDGEWKNGERSGRGVFTWSDGDKYAGEYKNNFKDGLGVFRWSNVNKYDGEGTNGTRHGEGVLKDKKGELLYEGQWVDDKQQKSTSSHCES